MINYWLIILICDEKSELITAINNCSYHGHLSEWFVLGSVSDVSLGVRKKQHL